MGRDVCSLAPAHLNPETCVCRTYAHHTFPHLCITLCTTIAHTCAPTQSSTQKGLCDVAAVIVGGAKFCLARHTTPFFRYTSQQPIFPAIVGGAKFCLARHTSPFFRRSSAGQSFALHVTPALFSGDRRRDKVLPCTSHQPRNFFLPKHIALSKNRDWCLRLNGATCAGATTAATQRPSSTWFDPHTFPYPTLSATGAGVRHGPGPRVLAPRRRPHRDHL
eukprot:18102-Chlamydomonas_euryale.AAC.1